MRARWSSPAGLWPAATLVIAACVAPTSAEVPAVAQVSAPEAPVRPVEVETAIHAPGTRREPRVLSSSERALAAWIESEARLTVRVGPEGGTGSGTLVSREGHVLTAAHVVDGVRWVDVTLPDGQRASARVLRSDATHDLALLETRLDVEHCAPAAAASPEIGDWLLVSGFAGAVTGEVPAAASLGLVLGVSSLPRPETAPDVATGQAVLAGVRIAPGMSGGPALDAHGRLVGVVAATGGRIAPIQGTSILDGITCDAASAEHALPPVIRDATHAEPDRSASLAALFEAAALTHRPDRGDGMELPSTVRLHASMGVYVEGVVVGDGLVLTLADDVLGTVAEPATGVTLVSHPRSTVIGPIAIAGELALIRVEGLRAPAIDARAAMPRLGELLASRERGEPGTVTATAIAPGILTPFLPPPSGPHCGTLLAMRYASAPRVEIARAFAHDVPASRGELLVDLSGRPVAIHVGHHVEGLGYAIPLSEALARFEHVLADRRAASR